MDSDRMQNKKNGFQNAKQLDFDRIRNGFYQNAKWILKLIILECKMDYIRIQEGKTHSNKMYNGF